MSQQSFTQITGENVHLRVGCACVWIMEEQAETFELPCPCFQKNITKNPTSEPRQPTASSQRFWPQVRECTPISLSRNGIGGHGWGAPWSRNTIDFPRTQDQDPGMPGSRQLLSPVRRDYAISRSASSMDLCSPGPSVSVSLSSGFECFSLHLGIHRSPFLEPHHLSAPVMPTNLSAPHVPIPNHERNNLTSPGGSRCPQISHSQFWPGSGVTYGEPGCHASPNTCVCLAGVVFKEEKK